MGSPGQTQTPSALLNNGTKIPLLGLGTGNFTTEEEIENVILTAIEAGYRHFDTASMYRSECALGKALKKAFERGLVNREDVFVTTKLWCTDVHPDDVLPALRKSLKELQLDYVDLYLIHWPVRVKKGAVFPSLKPDDILPVDLNSTWQAMEKLVGLGLAKAIGVSNFSSKKIHDLLSYATINPAVNQVEMHPFWQQRKLREYCRNVNIHVSAWSPLARGTGTAGSGGVINHPVIQEIARKHAKTPAQVALRWGIEQGASVVTKSYNKGRIYENISIFDWQLDQEDCQRIEGIEQKFKVYDGKDFVNPIHGPYKSLDDLWDGEI